MVDAHEVEDGGVELAEVDGVLHDVVAEVVSLAVRDARLHAGTGHPHGEAAWVVVAAVVGLGQRALRVDRASKLAAPNHERVFEHPARLEVEQQAGTGLVSLLALAGDVLRQVAVLVPAAVQDLHDADPAFDHAASEEGAVGEGAGLLYLGSVEVEGSRSLLGEVGQVGHAGLHAESHLILRRAGERFRVAELTVAGGVELREGVEGHAAVGGLHTGRVLDEEYGVAARAQGDARMARRQEATAPHAREERLAADALGREHHERGQVVALATEAVADPGADTRLAGNLVTGHRKRAGRVVIDRGGADGLHDGKQVDDLGGVRKEFADPAAGFPVLGELELARGNREARLTRGHGGDALSVADAFWEILIEVSLQLGLVVPEVELRRGAVHVQVDDALGLGREVRIAGERLVHSVRGLSLTGE